LDREKDSTYHAFRWHDQEDIFKHLFKYPLNPWCREYVESEISVFVAKIIKKRKKKWTFGKISELCMEIEQNTNEEHDTEIV